MSSSEIDSMSPTLSSQIAASLNRKPAVAELRDGEVNLIGVRPEQQREVARHHWSTDDGQERKQLNGISAYPAQAPTDDGVGIAVRVRVSCKYLDPERRAVRSGPQRFSLVPQQLGCELESKQYTFLLGQRLEPQYAKRAWRQELLESRDYAIRIGTRSGPDDQAERLRECLRGSH
jgi:hypothetical protein